MYSVIEDDDDDDVDNGDEDDDEKWIASICPIETIPTLCSEFLLIRRPSFSISLSLSLSIFLLRRVFLLPARHRLFLAPRLSRQLGNQFERRPAQRYFIRNAEAREETALFLRFSTHVNFNSFYPSEQSAHRYDLSNVRGSPPTRPARAL